ncbi:MAG: hypothetical protein RBU21_02030, partial [FCB group bacterium]|nr:hypothetical protein [FCB group bacterium]
MNVMTADFEFVLPLIIIIGIIASLIDKAKKASEEAKRQQLERERRMRKADLPEATRRQIYGDGEAPVRRAKPLVIEQIPTPDAEGRNDTGDGRNDEGMPVPPVRQPRPVRPVAVPAPPSTPWGELRRTLENKARDVEQEVRRQLAEAQRRQTPPQTEYDREQQQRRQRHEAQQAQRQQAVARRAQPAASRPEPARVEAPRPEPPARRSTQGRRRVHPLLGDMKDVRRAIVMREVFGPPKAFDCCRGVAEGNGAAVV